jgi:hypothetical protein
MTHKGKGPEMYENRETGGSHGGNMYNPEHIPYHQSKGSNGGSAPHGQIGGQIGSKTTPRSYLPMFTDEHAQHEPVDDFAEQMA